MTFIKQAGLIAGLAFLFALNTSRAADIEIPYTEFTLDNGLRVTATQPCQVFSGVEQAGVEEIRTGPAGFQGKITEAQHACANGEVDKIMLVVFH